MRSPEAVLKSLKSHSGTSGYMYQRLYRNLYNPAFYLLAYQQTYSKPGNMSPGVDGQTFDGMNLARIDKTIDRLKNKAYRPKPARRTYIPKKNGKLRPLGIQSSDDKLVQQVIKMMLESIYEDTFTDTSMASDQTEAVRPHLARLQSTLQESDGSLKVISMPISIW